MCTLLISLGISFKADLWTLFTVYEHLSLWIRIDKGHLTISHLQARTKVAFFMPVSLLITIIRKQLHLLQNFKGEFLRVTKNDLVFNQLSASCVIVLLRDHFFLHLKLKQAYEKHISYKIQTFIRILIIIVKMYPSPPTIVPSKLHVLLLFHLITVSNLSTFEAPTTLMSLQKFTSSFSRKQSKIFLTTLVLFSRACPHWFVFTGKHIRLNQSIQTRTQIVFKMMHFQNASLSKSFSKVSIFISVFQHGLDDRQKRIEKFFPKTY